VKALRELPAAAMAAMNALLNKTGSHSTTKAAANAASAPAGSALEGAETNDMAWMEEQVCSPLHMLTFNQPGLHSFTYSFT